MTSVAVKFNTADEAVDFVTKVNRYPFPMDLRWDNYKISAKSTLGVVGLSIGKRVKLCIDTTETGPVLKDIRKFVVK